MKGLEFLFDAMLEDVFTVQTAYASYPNLKFLGFEQENDDVILAVFSSPDTLDTLYFDISIPSNQVISQTTRDTKPFKRITKAKSMKQLEMIRTAQTLAGSAFVYSVIFN